MQDLYLDTEAHTYYYKGEAVPCVSDVLKLVDVITMAGIPMRNLEIAAERGTRVHEQTEMIDYAEVDTLDEDWQLENEDIMGYLIAYMNFLKDYPTFPLGREESLFSLTHSFAGTLDLVKYINGEVSIIDIKTSKTISKLRSELQLSAYDILWVEHHADMPAKKHYILQLTDIGEYRLIPIESNTEKFLDYLEKYKEAKGDVKL